MPTLLRLMTGENVLAQVTECDDHYIIEKAVTMTMMPAAGNQINIGMVPFCPFAKTQAFEIPKSAVLFIAEPEPEMANHYNVQFGSGIVTPSGPLPRNPLQFPRP